MAGYIATTKSIEWSTPPEVRAAICRYFVYSDMCDIDLACTCENMQALAGFTAPPAVLSAYALPPGKERKRAILKAQAECLTERLKGINREFTERHTFWLNPPYGSELPLWVKFAHDLAYGGQKVPRHEVILLIPARTDTKWFHDYLANERKLFIRGRLKFGGSKTGAPFPSVAVAVGTFYHNLTHFGRFVRDDSGRLEVIIE